MKHIYYKNDFAVEITLLNASGEVVAPPDWQWHIEFTDGRRKYICSVDKGNAKVVGNTIMCYIDNHKFCCGEVGYKFVQSIPDLNYLDGFQNLITPKALPIELWEQESDNDVNIQSSVVPSYVVYDAYMTAKANGYTGTAEEFYDALNHIVDIDKKEAERVEAEANRVTAEQQRVENFIAMESALTTATTAAEQSAERANIAADNADVATSNATTATNQATTATKRANDISADLEAKREADYWRGAKGEKGDKGDTGAKGDRGEKGDQGERGLQGVQGVKGDDGVSPTVKTSKAGKVTTIEITDAQGTHTATVNDGDSVEVVQSTGTSTTSVMSQKAVSDAINKLKNAGYLYAGIATPTTNPGTPDGLIFYFATKPGVYSNFGGIDVEEAAILQWSNGSWVKKIIGFATSEKLTELDLKINGCNSNYTPNKCLIPYGTINDRKGFAYTDYIRYTGDDIIWKYADTAIANIAIHLYNKDYNYINFYTSSSTSNERIISSSTILKDAPDTAFIRASFVMNNDVFVKLGDTIWTQKEASSGIAQRVEKIEDDIVNSAKKEDIAAIETQVSSIIHGQPKNFEPGKYFTYDFTNKSIIEQNKETWAVSEYITYLGGDLLLTHGNVNLNPRAYLAFYDNEKNWIKTAYWTLSNSSDRTSITSADISKYAPDAKYLRVSFNLEYAETLLKIGNVSWSPKNDMNGIDTLNIKVNNHEERITSLEDGKSGGILSLNKHKASAIFGIGAKVGVQSPKVANNYLTLCHISDIHGDSERYRRGIEFANEIRNIDAVLSTGDFNIGNYSDNGFEQTYVAHYSKTNKPVMPCIGNHDMGFNDNKYDNSLISVANRFITPYINSFGGIGKNGYYYKDFTDKKIRVIVINEYETPRIENTDSKWKYSLWNRYLSQEQVDWLISTLKSVESGWGIVIAMHQLIESDMVTYDNDFKSFDSDRDCCYEGQNGYLLQSIIDAYIGKTTINKTFANALGASESEIPSVVVNTSFDSAQGEFICYISGHIHWDLTGQARHAEHKQVNIGVTAAICNHARNGIYDDLWREEGTISEDAFNIVAFDTDKKQIRMLRIGANVTSDMRTRDYITIPYK